MNPWSWNSLGQIVSESGTPWPWSEFNDPKWRQPGPGSECDEIEVHPKDIPKKLKQIPTETMHLMTVSCGRPNYQVTFQNLTFLKLRIPSLFQNFNKICISITFCCFDLITWMKKCLWFLCCSIYWHHEVCWVFMSSIS